MSLQVVATIGPKSNQEECLLKLSRVADAFRLNASHLTPMELNKQLMMFRAFFQKHKKKKSVIIDLKGAKVRIGEYPSVSALPKKLCIKHLEASEDVAILPVPHQAFLNHIKIGNTLYLNDAKVVLKVLAIDSGVVECEVVKNGPLSSNKGINIKNHPVKYEELTPIDQKMIAIANAFEFTSFAFSFVFDGSEYALLKKHTHKEIIAKIEREESLEHLAFIESEFDALWLCRGDLGAQAGLEKLGEIQYTFSQKVKTMTKDVFLAGQVLHALTEFDMPTRTEISALYETKRYGYKGIVLSDETAVGNQLDAVVKYLELLNPRKE